ncbi:GLPGLI family protein [Flavobacterium sp. F-65]|uniref:GLPGLI family protein n=1 Tax=Flavobacterium pisciphilum TaxID=2893755 RepID=A0ABS8MT36_9FLAO|nr:GLPGLI family protein [Flavobacterium sp. F-65]MCC9071941.1 GLPGLI family protein [Flavobacterium sp. F-65]
MNKIFSTLIMMFGFYQAQAQKDFQGMAIYESKTQVQKFEGMSNGKNISPEMQKNFEEQMKKMLEKTFILNFNQVASIYEEEKKLDTPRKVGDISVSMIGGSGDGGGTFYKNVKDKSYTVDKEFMGKEFLIADSLPKIEWKLDGETKLIGGYTCYKATAIKKINRNFGSKDSDTKKDNAKKEEAKGKDEKMTNFMDGFETPKEIVVTAWYTPEIPINQGPENYWGLPGLILEINDGRTVILCSKIVMNAKDKVAIKAPTNGKIISQKAYDEIVVKKMKELGEMNQNRNNTNGSRGATIIVR